MLIFFEGVTGDEMGDEDDEMAVMLFKQKWPSESQQGE